MRDDRSWSLGDSSNLDSLISVTENLVSLGWYIAKNIPMDAAKRSTRMNRIRVDHRKQRQQPEEEEEEVFCRRRGLRRLLYSGGFFRGTNVRSLDGGKPDGGGGIPNVRSFDDEGC